MDLRKLLLSPHGRIGRQAYWVAVFLWASASAVTYVIDTLWFGAADGQGPATGLTGLAGLYPAVCVQSKRLHDLGRSGWLLLAPFGAAGATLLPIGDAFTLLVRLLALGVFIAFVIWLGCFKGAPASNTYGESNSGDRDPRSSADTFV